MKTKKLFPRILTVLFLGLTLSFTGCIPGDEPSSGGSDPGVEDPDNPDTPDTPSGGDNKLYAFTLYADTGYNIDGIRYTNDGQLVSTNDVWRFCNIGKVSDIAKIKTIPWASWATVTGVQVGDGIVAYHPKIGYMTIYVAQEARNEIGRVIGVGVIYRPNFTGLDEPVELKSTVVQAPAEGLKQDIAITSKSYTPFQVTSIDDDWCHAEATSVNGMFMPSQVTLSIDANPTENDRETRVLVGTIYGKTTYITVYQAGNWPGDDEE